MKKLDEIKSKLKKHKPEIIAASTTIIGAVGWILAAHYRNEMIKLETVDPNAWPMIEISPGAMKDIEDGATLKYRVIRPTPKSTYAQLTTLDDFSEEANEEFMRLMNVKENGSDA